MKKKYNSIVTLSDTNKEVHTSALFYNNESGATKLNFHENFEYKHSACKAERSMHKTKKKY